MKKLVKLIVILGLFVCATIQAQNVKLLSMTAGSVSNIFAVPVIIDQVRIINGATNTKVFLYDSSTNSTSVVRSAYTDYSAYSTNFDVVHTNASGLLVTNTFVGTYTAGTVVTAVTNERPKVASYSVAASVTLPVTTKIQTMRGLAAYTEQAIDLEITYRNNP